MSTRRTTLKTLAGAAVVGSLSGCMEFATQETLDYEGTPAMLSTSGVLDDGVQVVAAGVGVEVRSTVERLGVTREVRVANWGLRYEVVSIDRTDDTGRTFGTIVTFTTPSIEIAGEEFNPVDDLEVREIATEFVATEVRLRSVGGQSPFTLQNTTVVDATGSKVLRAFGDSIPTAETGGSEDAGTDETSGEMLRVEYSEPWPDAGTISKWDGSSWSAQAVMSDDSRSQPFDLTLRLDDHDGEFVAVFGAIPTGAEFKPGAGLREAVKGTITTGDGAGGFLHPAEAEFSRVLLEQHLQSMFTGSLEQATPELQRTTEEIASLVSESKAVVDSETSEYDRRRMLDRVDSMQRTIEAIQEELGGCDRSVCQTVREHAEDRTSITAHVRAALENENPDRAGELLADLADIVEEDISLLEGAGLERALELERSLLADTETLSASAAQWQTLLRVEAALDQLAKLTGSIRESLGGTLDSNTAAAIRADTRRIREVATRARERIASYNETRDQEDERLSEIERNLDDIGELARSADNLIYKSRVKD